MKTNIFQSWKTSIIGFALIISAIVSVFNIKSASWTDASLPIAIGIGLLLSPDTLLDKINSIFKKD